MRSRKIYGQSQELLCPFCGKQCIAKNGQGLPTCREHTGKEINLKCMCGKWLDIRESKFGTFFTCMDCGPVSWKRAWEINDLPIRSYEDL